MLVDERTGKTVHSITENGDFVCVSSCFALVGIFWFRSLSLGFYFAILARVYINIGRYFVILFPFSLVRVTFVPELCVCAHARQWMTLFAQFPTEYAKVVAFFFIIYTNVCACDASGWCSCGAFFWYGSVFHPLVVYSLQLPLSAALELQRNSACKWACNKKLESCVCGTRCVRLLCGGVFDVISPKYVYLFMNGFLFMSHG